MRWPPTVLRLKREKLRLESNCVRDNLIPRKALPHHDIHLLVRGYGILLQAMSLREERILEVT